TPDKQVFEVASVKPNKSGELFIRFGFQPGGRVTVTNAFLQEIVRFAYGLQYFQITGGPDWIRKDRFDISAKMPDGVAPGPGGPGAAPGPPQMMMRTLLADRFALKLHTETREMPVYSLVIARSDKPLPAALSQSTTDCAALMAGARGRPPAPPPP